MLDALRDWWLAILTTMGSIIGMSMYVSKIESRVETLEDTMAKEMPRLERWLLRVEAKLDRLLEERRRE